MRGEAARDDWVSCVSSGEDAPGIFDCFVFAGEIFLAMGAMNRSGGELSVVGGGAEKPEGTVSLLDAR